MSLRGWGRGATHLDSEERAQRKFMLLVTFSCTHIFANVKFLIGYKALSDELCIEQIMILLKLKLSALLGDFFMCMAIVSQCISMFYKCFPPFFHFHNLQLGGPCTCHIGGATLAATTNVIILDCCVVYLHIRYFIHFVFLSIIL